MWRSSEPNPLTHFQQWLDRLARPIEFASRDAFAHLPTVKNLNTFVSTQVLGALSDRVYPKSVEAALLKLRALFVEDQGRLTTDEQKRRLLEAAAIVKSLRDVAHDQRQVWEQAEPLKTTEDESPRVPSRDVGQLPIRFAKGVGPKRSSLMERLGIETVEDALWTVPWRYEDRSVMTPLGDLVPGMVTAVCAAVAKSTVKRTRNRRFTVLEVGLEDQTGRMQAVFFNQPYLEQVLAVGRSVMMSGRIIAGRQGWMVPRMEVSQYEVVGEGSEFTLRQIDLVTKRRERLSRIDQSIQVLWQSVGDQYLAFRR